MQKDNEYTYKIKFQIDYLFKFGSLKSYSGLDMPLNRGSIFLVQKEN